MCVCVCVCLFLSLFCNGKYVAISGRDRCSVFYCFACFSWSYRTDIVFGGCLTVVVSSLRLDYLSSFNLVVWHARDDLEEGHVALPCVASVR